jgi:hypothetical protein
MAPVWHALLGSAPAVSEACRVHTLFSSPVDGLDGYPDLGYERISTIGPVTLGADRSRPETGNSSFR